MLSLQPCRRASQRRLMPSRAPVAELAVELQRLAPRADRLAVPAGHRAFERARFEQRRRARPAPATCRAAGPAHTAAPPRGARRWRPRSAPRAARGRATSSTRPAPSAWCTWRASAVVGVAGVAQRGEHGSVQRRAPVRLQRLSTASRASSWRNASASPRATSRPCCRQPSMASAESGASVFSSARSAWFGNTLTRSASSRAAGGSCASRASTASVTDGGTPARVRPPAPR